ncbi:MAG: T9SS type B sorting domain-containing protein, partial [Bacteroidetes bacterium]
NISCNGQNDGSIDLTVTGGNLPYTINWSNGATTEDITSLIAGTYTVSIVDVNGCSIGGSETLLEPTLLENTISAFEYSSGDNISCFGYNDGSIDLEVTGGNAPYTYDWSNGETTQDLSAITADTYDVTVTDLNGCVTLATITLTEPSGMSNTITALEYPSGDEISCEGLSDGSIDLTITGGVAPYTYLWSNSETTEDLTGLSAGTYSVVVTEVNGCTITTSITLVEPTTLVLSDVSTNPSCYQFSNGDIDVTVSGGSPVYTYVWSTGASTEDLTDLTSGSYSIVATDINGCEVNGTFVLTQPDSLSIELESPLNFHDHNISLYGANDGMIYSTVNGGTTPYVYSWSNGSTEANLTGLAAGMYVVEIIDAQGCYATDTITLTEPFELELPTIFTPNQDGDNDLFDIHGIEAYPNNDLTVVNRWGNVVYTEEGYHNTWAGTHMNGEELPDGVYFVILKINGGEIEKNIYVHIKRY